MPKTESCKCYANRIDLNERSSFEINLIREAKFAISSFS